MIDPLLWIPLALAAWAVAAYLLIPHLWKRHYRRHFSDTPRITHTSDGHPGDPANVSIKGSESELLQAMKAAGWDPADPITLRSSLRIAVDSVLRRPDDDAPVSALFLYGRKQDFAFELPVGNRASVITSASGNATARRTDVRSGWVRPPLTNESVSVTPPARSPTTSAPTSMPNGTSS